MHFASNAFARTSADMAIEIAVRYLMLVAFEEYPFLKNLYIALYAL